MKKVVFEATPMVDTKKTGIGYYVDYLIRSLADTNQLDLEGYYFDFLGRNHKVVPKISHTRFNKISLIPGKLLSAARRLGWQPPLELFTRTPADIALFTNYVSLPVIQGSKVALIVYDLSFLDHPEFTQEKNLSYLNSFCSKSIRKADLIITISDFTKQRIAQLFPDIAATVVVTPIPPMPLLTLADNTTVLVANNLTPGKYILYVGTIEPRKNLENLVKAYAELPQEIRTVYPLVLAGGKGWKDESIHESIQNYREMGHTIVTTGYITDEEKEALYNNASIFVLPSHYEGFGMPILEAMQHGIPVAISDIPVFHEVAGEGAIYFNKDDPASIANTIKKMLLDENVRQAVIAAQPKELAKYSWAKNANTVTSALNELLNS